MTTTGTNNTKGLYLKLNKRTDADILEALESVSNKQGYIKALIRMDLSRAATGGEIISFYNGNREA